jgi:hypothetical protein
LQAVAEAEMTLAVVAEQADIETQPLAKCLVVEQAQKAQ